jgi:hypothetical protein
MRFFLVTFLLIFAFAVAFDASSQTKIKTVKIGDHKIPRPFIRDAISNSIESAAIDDSTCQTSVCEFIDNYDCVFDSSAYDDDFTSAYLDCMSDCAGAYYGCSTVDDSTCSTFGITQSTCSATSLFSDDDSSDDDSSDDDSIESACGSSCIYGIYQGLVQAIADCGPAIMGQNASDSLMYNNLCTENPMGDNCYLAVNSSEAILAGINGDCDAFFETINNGADFCSEVADMGCCAGTFSFIYPPCVDEYLTSTCGVDLSNKCSTGMFVDMKSVSSSLSFGSYADLNSTWTGYLYMMAIAEGASTGGEMIDYSYVDTPAWTTSMSRRLRGSEVDEEQRRLMGSTDLDFDILFLDGAYISSSGVVTAVDSSAFNTVVDAVVNNTITSKTAATTTTFTANNLFDDDDAAFSAPLNVVLVLTSMFLGLMLF